MWYCYRAVFSLRFGTRRDVLQRTSDNIFFIIPFARRRRLSAAAAAVLGRLLLFITSNII